MEEAELEEGEALSYHGEVENSTIDPESALSYIEEKLQNVLGHFQKDFEGGVSAENLGAKFGGYGSFLPAYQRSPSSSHKKGSTEVHNYDTQRSPKKIQPEDQRQNLLATSGASPIARLCDASQSTMPMVNSLTGNMHFPFRHVDDSSFKCGVIEKSSNPLDNRTLKLRIKVGSENLSNQKNAEIYSGLGLEVSPSSSWDDTPASGERLNSNLLDVQEQSPISILQIMASFFAGRLLSPLSEDLVDLDEKQNLGSKSESKLVNMASTEISVMLGRSGFGRRDQKVKQLKNSVSSEKNRLPKECSNGRNSGYNNNSVAWKEKETEVDTLVCDELVSNALKLPLLSNSQCAISDTTQGFSRTKIVPLNASKTGMKVETFSGVTEKKHLDSESSQDSRIEKLGESQGPTGKIFESRKGGLVGSLAACSKDDGHEVEKSHTSNQSVSNASKGREAHCALQIEPSKQFVRSEEGLQSVSDKSSSDGLKKLKGVNRIGSQGSNINPPSSPKNGKGSDSIASRQVSKNDSLDLQKDRKIHRDAHLKEIFGELVSEGNGSILRDSGRLKDHELVGKRSTSEYLSEKKSNDKISEKPHPSEKDFMLGSHVATPANGPSSETPTVMAPVVNEDWVSCDKCKKWRLLPLGMDPKSLPEKWLCRMLTWLPGMNRCSISEDETISALRALYHTTDLGPVPDSMRQHNQHHISAETFVAGTAIGGHCPGEEHQNVALLSETTSERKKHMMTHSENSTDIDGSTHSSNSRKNLSTSGKDRKSQRRNHRALNACEGTNLKVRTTHDSDLEGSRASKRIKEDPHSEDEKRSYENYGVSLKVDSMSTNHLSNNTSGSDGHTHPKGISSTVVKKENMGGLNPEVQVPATSDDDLMQSGKFAAKESAMKRKAKDHQTSDIQQNYQNFDECGGEKWVSDQSRKKKVRLSKSEGKDTSGSKSRTVINGNDRNMHEQCNAPDVNRSQAEDGLKSERCVVEPSVAANSSSSKLSSSRKNKTDFHEVKGSPVESVSSSPLRIHNTDKVTSIKKNLAGKDDIHDSYSLSGMNPKRSSGGENGATRWTAMVKKDAALSVNAHVPDICTAALCDQVAYENYPSTLGKIEENAISNHAQNTVSHSKKLVKELSSCSKEKTRTFRSDSDNNEIKASGSSHDCIDHSHMSKEKSKSRKNKFNETSGTLGTEKLNCKKYIEGGTSSESSKGQNQIKFNGRDGLDLTKSQGENHNFLQDCDNEKLRKKSCLGKANGNGIVHSLPPSSRVRNEKMASFQHVSGTEKENGVNVSSVHSFRNGDASKDQSKMSDNQNCQPTSLKHPTQNPRKVRDAQEPSPVRRESASHAANNALKEAKDLKHLADRLKNSGSTESNGFYFEAALKFLYGASLLEVGSSEGSKHNDLAHSMHIYSSTAKLCEFCAHEFEKSKNMAAAALAYKCVEVAYMRVVYSSNSNASKHRNELQSALRVVPPGESPFSSASDDDNLNQATIDKAAPLGKVVGSPQVSETHSISSQKRSGFIRLLNFAQDVHLAMEASRKSRNTFTSAISKLRETEICALKKALDFNFQDVDGLLRLVRVSMEAINR